MLKKFMSLFTSRKAADCGNTAPPAGKGIFWQGYNPRPANAQAVADGFLAAKRAKEADLQWPDITWPRQADDGPIASGTPHSRIHEQILTGKTDQQIAAELGVLAEEVRTYRHIISAAGRMAERRRLAKLHLNAALPSRVPAELARPAMRQQVVLESDLLSQCRRRTTEEEFAARVNLNETFGKMGRVNSQLAMYAVAAETLRTIDSAPPADNIESGQGGDFGGAGATGSWDGDRP
jgi:hypothetical protein